MIKKFCALLMVMCMVLTIPVQADNRNSDVSREIQYFEDGSYCVTDTYIVNNDFGGISTYGTPLSKSGVKYSSYFNKSNKLLWKYQVTGTFSYNGFTSVCTASSCNITDLSSGWKVKSMTASKSANKAIGTYLMHQVGGGDVTRTLTLTCTGTGALR